MNSAHSNTYERLDAPKIFTNQALLTTAGITMLIGVSIFAYSYLACRKKELDIAKESEQITGPNLGLLKASGMNL